MLYRLIAVITVVCLLAPATEAQDDPSGQAVALLMWKCNFAEMNNIVQVSDSLTVPIAQELVDEGKLIYYQMLTHDWADEWNVVLYYRAENKAALFEAWAEVGSRLRERHPDRVRLFRDFCTEHKDNIYVTQMSTTIAGS